MLSRRGFVERTVGGLASGLIMPASVRALGTNAHAQDAGSRPGKVPEGVAVINPRGRVPVSLIIDDSTCLVNLAHFCIPQFQEVFPNEYKQPWKTLPREIPDSFVRKFGEWCAGEGIKGKYSVIPFPACVGWLDRELPGWSKRELTASLELVRSVMMPNWDIHPEMVSHTWVINTQTGRPFPERTSDFMENWGWSVGKSADQLAEYMGFALRILKNAGLTCEGITTPGGFGDRALPELSRGTLDSCRDVFGAVIPHYFRHIFTDQRSVAPRVELASGLEGPDPRCVVSIVGCTGDWFGGWDGLTKGSVDQFITADLKRGRVPEVIARGEPAVLVCHWPGMYFNGEETGFRIFQEVVKRLHEAYDNLVWMKLSEIARYWAARELTRIERLAPNGLLLNAPFACPQFTVKLELSNETLEASNRIRLWAGQNQVELTPVGSLLMLKSGTFFRRDGGLEACLDLPKGRSRLELAKE
jgi:hypothetical protein